MLYIVPTPIGNLQDITFRAVKLFNEADFIITEDSRSTRKLFNLLEIINEKVKFVDITKNQRFNLNKVDEVLEKLRINNQELTAKDSFKDAIESHEIKEDSQENAELKVLLVSDAGTPGISDPGFEIIKLALEKNIDYTVLPGCNAIIPAAILSGLVHKEFLFLGFLPTKKGRQTAWKQIAESKIPIILYESVHRLEKFLVEAQTNLQAERDLVVCKDISKLYENIWRGKVSQIDNFHLNLKGEFVVVIG